MAEENKTVLLKIDLDVSGLKGRAEEAEKALEKLKIQQSLMRSQNQQGTVEYAKIQEQIKQYTKQLKDSASALVINEKLTGKSNLTDIEKAQAQKALATAYNNLTDEQRENTVEGQKITAQYKQVNEVLQKNGLAVSDGRRNVGLYAKAIADAKGAVESLTKQQTQIGFAYNQTKKDIEGTTAQLNALTVAGQEDSEMYATLNAQAEELNSTLKFQEEVLAETNTELESQKTVLAETEKEAKKIGFVYGENISALELLKRELREQQDILAGSDAGSEEYRVAALRAGELRDKLKEVKENTNALAGGSGFEKLSNTFEGLKTDLLNLDFEGVAEKSKQFADVAGDIKLSEVAKGAKNAGSALFNLGKVIIGNPIFLLVATIGAVIGAMYLFSEETETLTEENDRLNESFERSQNILELRTQQLVAQASLEVELAKIKGKSAKEILDLELRAIDEEEAARDRLYNSIDRQILALKKRETEARIEGEEELEQSIKDEIKAQKDKQADLFYLRQELIDKTTVINAQFEKDEKDRADKAREESKKRADDAIKLAREVAQKIADETFKGQELTNANRRTIINNTSDYLTTIANLTIEESLKLNEELLKIENERFTELRRIDDDEAKTAISKLRETAKNELAELKGSESQKAVQRKLINENLIKEVESIQIEFDQRETQRSLDQLQAQKNIADSKVEINQKANDDILLNLEADLLVTQNANLKSAEAEIAIAAEKNKQIQEDKQKSDAEKRLAEQQYQAEIIAINKASSDKQIEIDKEAAEQRKQIQEAVIGATQELTNSFFQIQAQKIQQDLDNTSSANEKKQESLQQQLDAGVISQEQYDQKKKSLDDKAAKQESDLKKKAFEQNKRAQIINAAIATAVGVVSQLQAGPAGFVLAALAAALGIAQIAVISSQETPEFAHGGKVLSGKKIGTNDGRSVYRRNGDNLLATVKTGEVILNRDQQSALGGDATFARIGVPGFASGGYTGNQISRTVDQRLDLGNLIVRTIREMPNPVVDVLDINAKQSENQTNVESGIIR